MEHPVVPLKTYLLVYLALLILFGFTIAVAFIDFGIFDLFATLTIAIAKALLVILFFMHLRYSTQLTKIFATAGFVWLFLLLGLTLTDYVSRGSAVPLPGF
jgi:cytochrome c oxidase subunit IV